MVESLAGGKTEISKFWRLTNSGRFGRFCGRGKTGCQKGHKTRQVECADKREFSRNANNVDWGIYRN